MTVSSPSKIFADRIGRIEVSATMAVAAEAAKLAKDAQAHTLILTHFSARYTDNVVFEQEARTIFGNSYAASDLQRFGFRDQK